MLDFLRHCVRWLRRLAFVQKIEQIFMRPTAGTAPPGGVLKTPVVGDDHQRLRIGCLLDLRLDAVIGALAGRGEFNVQAFAGLRAREIAWGMLGIENDGD